MLGKFIQRQIQRPLKIVSIVISLAVLGSIAFYVVTTQYSLNLAQEFVPIPSDARNLKAFYIGIGQGRTLYVRLDLVGGSEEKFLSELCEERYTNIDNRTNPFQDMSTRWWIPDWWMPSENPESYLGGECSNYRILINKTTETIHTTHIMVIF